MKKTNFDIYLEGQLKDQTFSERFKRAGEAWDLAVQCDGSHAPCTRAFASYPNRKRRERTKAMEFTARFVLCLSFVLILSPLAARSADNWTLVWHDEFNKNGPPDPANWTYENGFVRNNESQWYQPENAYCTNGLLIIEARPEHRRNPWFAPGSTDWRTARQWIDYTSASLTTRGLHQFKYGKFEMRARIDTRPGSWPAFWTLGAGAAPWPDCGEIDIMEYYAGHVLANIAYKLPDKIYATWSTVKKPIKQLDADTWSKKFHIWTMEWDEKKIDLLLDGRLMNHFDLKNADHAVGGNPFHKPLYLKLNQAIGGTQGGDPSHTAFPIRFEIDWVRVYQRAWVSSGK